MHTLVQWVGGGGGRTGVPWHTNRHDRNKIKRVGLRQNMYGPLNRELIKELKLLVLSAEPARSHTNSHIILILGILLSVSLNNGESTTWERQMSLPVLAGVSV